MAKNGLFVSLGLMFGKNVHPMLSKGVVRDPSIYTDKHTPPSDSEN